MRKLYTEEQVRKAISLGYDWCHQKHIPDDFMIDNFINSLTPIQLPTDEEIEKIAKEKHIGLSIDVQNYRRCFVQGANWMRDKIKGGDNETI